MISTMPATRRDCGLISLSLGAAGKDAIHEVDTDASWRGVCSCSTTSSLTCSLPTSSSPMLRRSILPLLIASARIARAPMARAPNAPAPTARAPSAPAPLATRPIATRSKAACLPEAEWFLPFTVRFLTILLPCPSSPWRELRIIHLLRRWVHGLLATLRLSGEPQRSPRPIRARSRLPPPSSRPRSRCSASDLRTPCTRWGSWRGGSAWRLTG